MSSSWVGTDTNQTIEEDGDGCNWRVLHRNDAAFTTLALQLGNRTFILQISTLAYYGELCLNMGNINVV